MYTKKMSPKANTVGVCFHCGKVSYNRRVTRCGCCRPMQRVDDVIVDTVLGLRSLGVNTMFSCAGHFNHNKLPSVSIAAPWATGPDDSWSSSVWCNQVRIALQQMSLPTLVVDEYLDITLCVEPGYFTAKLFDHTSFPHCLVLKAQAICKKTGNLLRHPIEMAARFPTTTKLTGLGFLYVQTWFLRDICRNRRIVEVLSTPRTKEEFDAS